MSIKTQYEEAVQAYTNLFCEKHDLTFDFWVGDIVGEVSCLSDEYFVDFGTMKLDIDNDMPVNSFFDWYELNMELGEDRVNYYSYFKGYRP